MREVNRSIILDLIRGSAQVSRTELARRSSLTKPTVSTIVEELLEEGVIVEVGFSPSEPTGGRRARLIEFNPASAAYAGIRFGVGSTTVAVADGLGRILNERRIPSVLGRPDDSIARARDAFLELLGETNIPRSRVQALGAAVGGLIDADSGRCVLSPNLGWSDVPVRELLRAAFGVPVVVANVTDAAAVAEARFGVAQEVREFVWVYVGTGIGAGIVSAGQIFRGRSGFAGEIGFCREARSGRILEEVASGRAMVERVRALPGVPGALTTEGVMILASEGHPEVRAIVEEAGAALGLAIAHTANILNPELVVLGGNACSSDNFFVETVRRSFAEQVLGPEKVPVVRSALPGSAVNIGSVLLAMTHSVQSVRITSR